MADDLQSADHGTLLSHLKSLRFRAGVEEGRWAVLTHDFPSLIVSVSGQDFTGSITASMHFQLLCDGYPIRPPFVQQWDIGQQARPEPPNAEEGPPGVIDALKTWSRDDGNGYGGIYRAWQRYAAVHNNWATLRPDEAWNRQRDLTFIMEMLYALVSEQASWMAVRAAA